MEDGERIRTMRIKVVNKSNNPLPKYETPGSAGMDIMANLEWPATFAPMERKLIPTGLFIELQPGFEAQLRPRSGLSIKQGLTLINCIGTIDSDYRGEIKVPIINLSGESQVIQPGERIAQMVINNYVSTAEWDPVDELTETERGSGGFGSTGK